MKATLTATILLMAVLVGNLSVSANTWNFVNGPTSFDYGTTTHTFTDVETHSISIKAYGEGCFMNNTYLDYSTRTPDRACGSAEMNAKPINLYNKYITGDITEQGLGLTNDPLGVHEISASDFINLDLSKLGNTNATLWISSIQPTESFSWCLGPNANTSRLGSPCSSPVVGTVGGPDPYPLSFHLDGANNVLSIIGRNKDVLIVKQLTTVPEPAVVELLGAVLGVGVFFRRRLLALS